MCWGVGTREGNFFSKCKINEHALDTKPFAFLAFFFSCPICPQHLSPLVAVTKLERERISSCHVVPLCTLCRSSSLVCGNQLSAHPAPQASFGLTDRHYDPWCLSSSLWKIQTWGYWIIRSLSHVGKVLATRNHSFEFFLFLSQHLLICLWMCTPRCFWRSEDNFGCSFHCVSSGDWTQGTRLAGRYLAEV